MSLPALYKINLKTDAADRAALVDYCLENSFIGVGWGPHYFRDDRPRDFDDYYAGVIETWGSKSTGPVRWLHDAAIGSLVWFRDLKGNYYLGRLTGEWRPLHGPESERLDLANLRDIDYALIGSEAGVPGAVIRGYAAPKQWAFSHVNDDGARAYSALLAHELLGCDRPDIELTASSVLSSLLGPLDVEDLVAAFLQDTRGYIALPARHGRTKQAYEYVLKHREDGHVAVVQVKTGGATVPVATLDERTADRWYVYTDSDQELPGFVERISREALVDYMQSQSMCLPPVIEVWMRRIAPCRSTPRRRR